MVAPLLFINSSWWTQRPPMTRTGNILVSSQHLQALSLLYDRIKTLFHT
jgi:hypothetical protein